MHYDAVRFILMGLSVHWLYKEHRVIMSLKNLISVYILVLHHRRCHYSQLRYGKLYSISSLKMVSVVVYASHNDIHAIVKPQIAFLKSH